jgi:hypothetical protein
MSQGAALETARRPREAARRLKCSTGVTHCEGALVPDLTRFDAEALDGGLSMRVRREALRIAAQHHQLDQFHAVFEDALARGDMSGARVSFASFADALEAHFSLEEEFYFPALHGFRRDLAGDLARLTRDHAALRSGIAQLSAELAQGDPAACELEFQAWLAQLLAHERSEEALMASRPPESTPVPG